jgi:hypothetical protein
LESREQGDKLWFLISEQGMFMRYLKVVAQDRAGTGRADCVLLRFYEQEDNADEALQLNSAFALDIDADGIVDTALGDVNNDGTKDAADRQLLRTFTNTYLQFNWFNPGTDWSRHLKVYSEDYHNDGTINCINFQLYENGKIAAWHAVFDVNNDAEIRRSTRGDINGDRQIDKLDQTLLFNLGRTYLEFNWN